MPERSGPVTFAPGKYARLKYDTCGRPAGTVGMLSGEVLFRPEDEGKLSFCIYPGTADYDSLKVPRDALEWASDAEERAYDVFYDSGWSFRGETLVGGAKMVRLKSGRRSVEVPADFYYEQPEDALAFVEREGRRLLDAEIAARTAARREEARSGTWTPQWPAALPADERRSHRCDNRCVCPIDVKPMFYSAAEGVHACQDPECQFAHGGIDA